MDGQSQHGFTQRRDSRGFTGQAAQKQKQPLSLRQPLAARSVEPIELRGFVNAPGVQGEDRAGEVDAVDFGLLELGPAAVFALGPEANAGARASAARLSPCAGQPPRD